MVKCNILCACVSRCDEVRIKLMTREVCLNIVAQNSSFFITEEELHKLSTNIDNECSCALRLSTVGLQ